MIADVVTSSSKRWLLFIVMNTLRAFGFALICFISFCMSGEEGFVFRHPGPYPEGMDTWYGSLYNRKAMQDGSLWMGGSSGGVDEYDILTRFDLSGLPQKATRVVMYFCVLKINFQTSPVPINWEVLNTQWQSGTVGWDNRPKGLYMFDSTLAPVNTGWYGWDCTYVYNQWRKGDVDSLNFGLKMIPKYNNNWFNSFQASSSMTYPWARPYLYVWYEKGGDDNIIKLKWPIDVGRPSSPSLSFGSDWGLGESACQGLSMKHVGADIPAPVGTQVFACEDGFVKEILTPNQTGGWASAIVMEHNQLNGNKYTSVYWHVTPVSVPNVNTVAVGDFVPKGYQIATIANISPRSGSHLHFGIRLGAYQAGLSNKGSLPSPTAKCTELPSFPDLFINPFDNTKIAFK